MLVVAWLWFIVAAFFFLVALGEGSVMAAAIAVVPALLSLPPLWKRVSMSGKNTFPALRGILSVLLVPLGIGVTMANSSPETQKRTQFHREAGQHCLSSGEHPRLVELVQRTLRNPDSFQHDGTTISKRDPDGMHRLTMTYRAENGFGGMNIEHISATVASEDCSFSLTAE